MKVVQSLKGKAGLYLLIVLLLAGAAGYFYWQNRQNLAKLENPTQASEAEAKELTDKVSKLMDLPTDEKPTVITVVDKEKVKSQAFFTKAENGDKVLVYTSAKKAILYRPSTDKVIEVGPVEISATTTFKVALYSVNEDLANLPAIESKLKESVTNLEYTVKQKSKTKTSKILVVDVNGSKPTETAQIAKLIDGEVTTLPEGETKPDADFLIIAGK
jgi:cell division protein FtsB